MKIGSNIYNLRKEKKITQAQLAEMLGVSEQAISKWENGVCAPDVSLFPVIAEYFGVSIDRIFGYYMNGYEDDVKAIMKAADDSMDTYKEIEIISEGLKKYPNSPELKVYLAFSLSMVNRMSNDEEERSEAVEKAIKLCTEVVDRCGDVKQVNDALHMLSRIYIETGNYNRAEECINRISADGYDCRITDMVNMLGSKNCLDEQNEFAQKSLYKLYWTMSHVFESVANSSKNNMEYEKALNYLKAHEKLLSVFDYGCDNFFATYKIIACESKAQIYMNIGDEAGCIKELKKFFELAKEVEKVAESKNFDISKRNPIYFSCIKEEIPEEYMTRIYPERILSKYDGFLKDNKEYIEFKTAIGI
ncbi:MAG: helix-turn-helix transcriptional regulator [Clostridia bacterium]|nr:helix-turn-helix transcriptional regulator [Clostridia bacterium]